MSQDQQGQGDWHKYMSQDQGERPSQGQSQDLLFNFTVTGKNIQIESSFGLGGGEGDLEISSQTNPFSPLLLPGLSPWLLRLISIAELF